MKRRTILVALALLLVAAAGVLPFVHPSCNNVTANPPTEPRPDATPAADDTGPADPDTSGGAP